MKFLTVVISLDVYNPLWQGKLDMDDFWSNINVQNTNNLFLYKFRLQCDYKVLIPKYEPWHDPLQDVGKAIDCDKYLI